MGLNQAQLIAKIGYGFAIACFGAKIINTAYVLPSILGQSEDIGRWVGCISERHPPSTNLHEMKLGLDRNHIIRASVRLFAKYGGPEYLVIVGPAPDKETCKPDL